MKNGGSEGVGAPFRALVRRVDPRAANLARARAAESVRAQDCSETDESGSRTIRVLGARAGLIVSGSRDERLAAIAQAQRGRVSRQQLRQAGIGYGAIARLVRSRRLLPLPGGVFAIGSLAPAELADETAALLAAGPGSVLSHHTAAVLWEIRPRDDGPINVVVPPSRGTRTPGIRIHRSGSLTPRDVRIRKGLPVTSPAWTLLDEAPTLTPRELELAFDRALVAGIMRLQDVAELLKRVKGRPGAPALRALLEDHQGSTVTRSGAEELFLELIRTAHLPQPRVNARTCGYEVDFLWPEQRLVVEIDGFRFHSTRRAFEHDHRRDAALRAAGFIVLRFTYDQLRREPLAVVATVATMLTAADAQVATISAPSSREIATSTE